MAKTPISITLDEDVLDWVDIRCKDKGLNRSAFIEQAMRAAKAEDDVLRNPGVRSALGALASPGVLEALNQALGGALGEREKKVVADQLNEYRKAPSSHTRKTK